MLVAYRKKLKKLDAKLQNALRLLARTEEERRIAVAQVAHLKEVIDQKNDVIANLNGREGK